MVKNTSVSSYKDMLDNKIRPQDDFFSYVNGKWIKNNPIPESETRWGTFNILRDKAWEHMKDIYEELESKNLPAGSIKQQARDFFYTGMRFNEFKSKHLGLMDQLFEKVDSIISNKDLSRLLGELHRMNVCDPWAPLIDADDKNSTVHILRLRQSGLTLPDRDYYLENNPKMREIRRKYEDHARKVYGFFPKMAQTADVFWSSLWNFEIDIAKNSRSRVELRDVEKNYNKTTFASLLSTYQQIDWEVYAKALGWRTDDKLTVDQPEFFEFINTQFASRSLEDWKIYLKWQIVVTYYGRVSDELAELRFEFFNKVLGGSTQIIPLWKRVVINIDQAIGEGVGRLYVERHFPEASKKQVLSLVEDIRDAYKERIQELDWMSPKTKEYALKKLKNIKVLIGYPDKWRDYTKLKISKESYISNIIAAEKFENDYLMQRLHEPISRDDWFMYPQTVNAYHDPNRLVICFPAAILQQPFFDPDAHYAINMGGVGTIIAHEFTHGFDDQGCLFDAEGNMRTWQTDEERKAFDKKAQIIIDQADKYEVLTGVKLKGKLVIGEAIADLGGLEISYHALANRLGEKIKEEIEPGLSAEQLFFINYASTECGKTREEKIREYAISDPHPAEEFRVNATVQHVSSFYQTFDVIKTDKLYRSPETRAKIW